MTHTLHRRVDRADIDLGGLEDFIIMVYPAKGLNDKGSAEKLRIAFKLLSEANPDNIRGEPLSRGMGYTDEEILKNIKDGLCTSAVFSDRTRVKDALEKIKKADLGLSVVFTGNYEAVFDILKECGLKAHTVNMSLGIFGNKSILPSEDLLPLVTMCGHRLVSVQRIENTMEKVKSGKLTPEKGGKILASTCNCGMFNPKLAARILEKALEKER